MFRRDSKELIRVPALISCDCSIKGLTIKDILKPKNRPAFRHLKLHLKRHLQGGESRGKQIRF